MALTAAAELRVYDGTRCLDAKDTELLWNASTDNVGAG